MMLQKDRLCLENYKCEHVVYDETGTTCRITFHSFAKTDVNVRRLRKIGSMNSLGLSRRLFQDRCKMRINIYQTGFFSAKKSTLIRALQRSRYKVLRKNNQSSYTNQRYYIERHYPSNCNDANSKMRTVNCAVKS